MREDCPTSPPECLDDDTVAGFVDGNLATAERARVERVIDACATCRRQVSEVIRMRTQRSPVAPERIGRYEVRGVLGQGGMGIVLRAWDPQLERAVALKLVRGESGDGTQRLVREARAIAKLRHASVITVYDVTVEDAQLCVVMELVDGGNLADWFATRPPWQPVVARCTLAGHGLIAAHEAGLIHRDFKPANVLCAQDGRVLVADFGLARTSPGVADAASALTSANTLAGTPAYMAPELLLGEPIGAAADQFAFAATLYEGLFGVRPFGGTTVAALISEILSGQVRRPPASEVPAPIVAAVMRGLSREPADRWPSLRAMLDALARPAARRSWLPIAGAATAAAIVAGLGAWVTGIGHEETRTAGASGDPDRVGVSRDPAGASGDPGTTPPGAGADGSPPDPRGAASPDVTAHGPRGAGSSDVIVANARSPDSHGERSPAPSALDLNGSPSRPASGPTRSPDPSERGSAHSPDPGERNPDRSPPPAAGDGTSGSSDAAKRELALPSITAAQRAHFDLLGDRGPFEAVARAWASDAKLRSLQATELDVNGTVDLERGVVEYVFVSRALEASDPLHCAFALNIQHGVVAAVHGERGCDVGGELGPPRCTLGTVWNVAERSDADPKKPAAVAFSDGRWELAQGTLRVPVLDRCR